MYIWTCAYTIYFAFSILALQCFQKVTIKIQRVSHGVLIGFHWQDLPQPPTEPEPSTGGAGEPAEPSEPGPGGENAKVPRKRAKAGQGAAGISFARRTCPKTCPARERWRAAKAVFEEKIAPCLLELGFRKGLYEARVKKMESGWGWVKQVLEKYC